MSSYSNGNSMCGNKCNDMNNNNNSQKECNYNNQCESCYYLEQELRDVLEYLMSIEEHSNKKIDKAREYQEQVGILISKAMEAQCRASDLLSEVDCIENESAQIRENLYSLIYRTIDCYKKQNDNKCSCKCKCECNCCNKR